jgi:transposase
MTKEALEARLYPASVAIAQLLARRPRPNRVPIHRELKRPGVTLEVSHRGKRVAAHLRFYVKHAHTTLPEHMPSSRRRYADWTPERFKRDASKIGPKTSALVGHHPAREAASRAGLPLLSGHLEARRRLRSRPPGSSL